MVLLRLVGLLLLDVSRDFLRNRGQHVLAIATLASGLLLAGGGLLGVDTVDRWVARMEGLARVTVFAADGGDLAQAEAILRKDPRFVQVRKVSSEEATRRFLDMGREAGLLLQALGGEKVPENLELTLRDDLRASRRAVEAGDSLRALPGVGDVVVDHERLQAFQRSSSAIRSALSGLGLILLLAAGFATGNVIRMTILAREEEIGIMRLVGATEAFIRRPLLVEGAILGLVASLVAVLGLYALWFPLSRGMTGVPPLLSELARMGFFSWKNMLLLSCSGTLTGALGAWWGFWATQRGRRKVEGLGPDGTA